MRRFSIDGLFVVGFAAAILFLEHRLVHGGRHPSGWSSGRPVRRRA